MKLKDLINKLPRFPAKNARWITVSSTEFHRQNADEDYTLKGRLFVGTLATEPFKIPLTLSDVHLKDEQLPFSYFFDQTFEPDLLVSSFKEVFRRYPILGGRVNFDGIPTIQCSLDDHIPISFALSKVTLNDWLSLAKQGKKKHMHGPGSVTLMPLFDDLSSKKWNDESKSDIASLSYLATARVTYFKGGGTSLGINISHLVGDTNSCIRIAQCWGREMRGLCHPIGASNSRFDATCAGMITLEQANVLDFKPSNYARKYDGEENVLDWILSFISFSQFLLGQSIATKPIENQMRTDANILSDHEYVLLHFKPELLEAMKAYGMDHVSKSDNGKELTDFVSTNDMVTAFTWLIKRHFSGKHDYSISMVVNLRGRAGVDPFSDINDEYGQDGVFGNAITNIIAKMPAIEEYNDWREGEGDKILDEVSTAAIVLREALDNGIQMIPDRLTLSKSGQAESIASERSFSTTSWNQFPIWDIRFSDDTVGGLKGFHGQPAYPLPKGDTYTSVLIPDRCGGIVCQLLTPSRQVQEVLSHHRNVSRKFLNWFQRQKKRHSSMTNIES
mmetsp:Transcript_31876/g.48161  ORF Transcript_31876/g.48161 Transcript_31876/m.48161 type:complete len:560 (-) Transcript_31876:1676-3355(-)